MSYSIIYRPLFVKFSNEKYLTFTENGDSNVYDADLWTGRSTRRSRSWGLTGSVFSNQGKMPVSLDEILLHLQENSDNSPHSEDDFYSAMLIEIPSKKWGLKHYKNFAKNSAKKALTFEELAEKNIKVCIRTYYDEKEPFSFYAENEAEYFAKLKKAKEKNRPFYVTLIGSEHSFKVACKMKNRVRRKSDPSQWKERYAIYTGRAYVTKLNRSKTLFTSYVESNAKLFPTLKKTRDYIEKVSHYHNDMFLVPKKMD